MSNVLNYKGYSALVEFDADDRIFFGRVAGIADGVSFHGDTVDDLISAFREAVEDYLESCGKIGKKPERPYSGSVMIRVSPELHARIALTAELAGKSINQFGEELFERAVI